MLSHQRSCSLTGLLTAATIAVGAIVAVAHSTSGDIDVGDYWRRPLASQGEPPGRWSAVERSLAPADCGQCHSAQLTDWQTSRHAHSFSPGLVGQLLTLDPGATAECMQCHAPLDEQRAAFETARGAGAAATADGPGIASAGNSCGGCHLRAYRHFGPPQRGSAATGPSETDAPHGGVFRTALFEKGQYCGSCHQFAAETAVNGKPLENTVVEWEQSAQAAHGITCQSCHMPDRRHLWRGIHDPGMVASGLTPRFTVDAAHARFEIINTGVGHAFPTYVTPKVMMRAVALDAEGAPRAETLRSREIARDVRYVTDRWVELADSRLLPGQSATIELSWNGSDRVRVWLDVVPDDFYEREVFPSLIEALPAQSDAQRLITKAAADAAVSHYRLFETELKRP